MRLQKIALAAAVTLLTLIPPALASEGSTIIEHCAQGRSLGGFSQNGYREALKQLATGTIEYSPCATLIRKAELAATLGGASGAGNNGGELAGATSNTPIPLTPAEQQAVLSAHKHGSTPVLVDGKTIKPGVVHANLASTASTLPTSLLAVLAMAIGGTLLFALGETLKRARARRHR